MTIVLVMNALVMISELQALEAFKSEVKTSMDHVPCRPRWPR